VITRDLQAFTEFARNCPADFGPACAKAVFLVAPEQFALAEQSASDNRYMDLDVQVDPARAAAQHRQLQQMLAKTLPTICFPGDAATPDAQFPNNVFATAPGRLLLGHMRHPVRQAEVEREDIRRFFRELLGYEEIDLRAQPGICELTGSLIIDHARGLGLCGLSERCDEAGAAAMHAAFGLRTTLLFDLAPGEYHSNVVLSVLAGRAVVIAADGFADRAVVAAIAALYAPHAILLSAAEKRAFAGNCLALADDQLWLSQAAVDGLSASNRAALEAAGFALHGVALDEIEKAGGSLRCCVAEIF
jgi:N-dimethylarginine dimethylaminohydrolase